MARKNEPHEPCVWCLVPVGDNVCFNGADICIDCCYANGDPCGHGPAD